MTLLNLVIMTLRNMNEDIDGQTIEMFKDEIIEFINVGYQELLVQRMKACKTEEIKTVDGRGELSCTPIKIISVFDEKGRAVDFSISEDVIYSSAKKIKIVYNYLPDRLVLDEDVPEFDPSLHFILADYATYRMFIKGSTQRQARGEAFYASFLTGASKLLPQQPSKLINKFGADYGTN